MNKKKEKNFAYKKSGSALVSPDKHKTSWHGGLLFNLLDGLAYDLEGLGAGARQ
ncbi:hypothetical protein [Robertmurraya andreesenii]|uniref:Uncharacterized protein n=1 Tax=Anoxybacillus andreesenii TaxID=1325932 RepID=A0ABT9V4P5_9BACL|nr:hypothetical protein [Robertmurraya andreesenii]MDQ0155908.1 hypothetical protein [Robertmurraya andreesenii]